MADPHNPAPDPPSPSPLPAMLVAGLFSDDAGDLYFIEIGVYIHTFLSDLRGFDPIMLQDARMLNIHSIPIPRKRIVDVSIIIAQDVRGDPLFA